MRRAFRFRLERIARVRALLEAEARSVLQLARGELSRADEQLANAANALTEAREAQRHARSQPQLQITEALAAEAALESLLRSHSRALRSQQTAREKADQAALAHQIAQINQKALERLETRASAAHATELAHYDETQAEEQREMRPSG